MPPEPPRGQPRVWVVSDTYFPELTSTGYYMTGLAEGLAASRPVSVVCGQPQYALRGTIAPRRETRAGVDIHRVRGLAFNKNRIWLRLLNIASFSAAMFGTLLRRLRRHDVVLVVTNPPTVPYLVRLATWLRGARAILIVHDVYPDAMIAAGMLSPSGLTARMFRVLSSALLKSMDEIIVIGRDMADLLGRRVGSDTHIVPIPIWASEDLIASEEAEPNALRTRLGLTDHFVLQYAGNIGRVQDMPLLVNLMRRLAADAPDARLLVIGGGARREWLEATIATVGLSNILVLPEQPREGQAEYLRACDVAVMAFVPGMYGVGVPSRLYNIMATGRAVIAAVEPQSEPGRVITEEAIGWVVPPGDAAAFAAAVCAAMADRARLAEMGVRARRAALAKYQRGAILGAYAAAVDRCEAP